MAKGELPDGAPSVTRSRRRVPSAHVEGKRRAKRLKILESAVKSFARRGFWGTSMEEIAEDLLLTRASLYYYFRDKEEILALCHGVALEAVNEELDRVRAAKLPPDRALAELVAAHVRIMVDKFHGTALALEFDALDAKRRADVVTARDRFERGLRDIVSEGVASGVFRAVDPKLTGFAIFGAINWIARWYRTGGGTEPDEVARAYAELFVRGLLAPGKEGP